MGFFSYLFRHEMKARHIATAFFLAPWAPALVIAVILLFKPDHVVFSVGSVSLSSLGIIGVAAALGYVAILLFGLPLFFLARRRGFLAARHCVLGGGLAACLFFMLLGGSGKPDLTSQAPLLVVITALLGMVAGLAFWVIVRLWNTPADAPNP